MNEVARLPKKEATYRRRIEDRKSVLLGFSRAQAFMPTVAR